MLVTCDLEDNDVISRDYFEELLDILGGEYINGIDIDRNSTHDVNSELIAKLSRLRVSGRFPGVLLLFLRGLYPHTFSPGQKRCCPRRFVREVYAEKMPRQVEPCELSGRADQR